MQLHCTETFCRLFYKKSIEYIYINAETQKIGHQMPWRVPLSFLFGVTVKPRLYIYKCKFTIFCVLLFRQCLLMYVILPLDEFLHLLFFNLDESRSVFLGPEDF